MTTGQVLVPYTDEPDVGIGDVIIQKSGKREIHIIVIDASFLEEGSLGAGKHPHMLTLKVENTTSQPHVTSTFNIGSINA
jgi:predicted nuclease of predicted toxin-antitoxin system